MNKKILTIALMSALMLSVLFPLVSVSGAGVPNPNHIYDATFGGPETVDPAWAYDTASGELIQNVFEPLCQFAGNSTEKFASCLADDWPGYDENSETHAIIPEVHGDGTETWYFHMRSGVKFHDNTDLETHDIEYTFERGMLMDHSGGPQWMLYEPLLGVMGSSEYDTDGGGINSTAEYLALEDDIKAAIGENGTWVWFNLVGPYAPFQQILSQTWGCILSEAYAVAHGCWNGLYNNYTEFQRCYDPPSPGPLMSPVPEAMGTGPYKLAAMNTDPHTGWYTLEKWTGYWQAQAPTTYATVKNVEEWANRKAQFFSTDPAMQADFCVVPRANVREMHPGGNKDADPYPGFRLFKVPRQAVDAVFFNYNVSLPSDYVPKMGLTDKPDLFSDRNMRLAFIYSLNITKFIIEYYLQEATHPTTCMPPGTAFYDSNKEARWGNTDAELAKAQAALDAAWGGQAKTQGITVKLTYNAGNTARETVCRMIEDIMEHQLNWTGSVDIQPTGVPWSTYLVELYSTRLSAFTLGWLADFPDPHNWYMPFMHSHGDYACYGQAVTYGLGDISASWPTVNVSYGPPPYTNYQGQTVNAINNTYVDTQIETALGLDTQGRNQTYRELMDIYFAEASQQPTITTILRHYERIWIHGWINTWNENPISPGYYFYTITKSIAGTVYEVDVSAYNVAMSPTSSISEFLKNQPYHAPQTAVPWIKLNTTTALPNVYASVTAYAKYYNASGPDVMVFVMWLGTTLKGHSEEFGRAEYLMTASSPGNMHTFGPKNVSNWMPKPGDYKLTIYCFVFHDNAFNVNATANFNAEYFNSTGYCDTNADERVDMLDYQRVKRAVGGTYSDISGGNTKWNMWCDVDCTNSVIMTDYQKIKRLIPTTY